MDETISISTLKDFEILKQIGKGSFGTVYRVKRKKDGVVYALKSMNISAMDKKGIENCLNEIRILCSIVHPNIVGYKEAFLDKKDSELNIVMEYVGGGDLASKISQCAKRKLLINESTIWKYFCQTLVGLKALHSMKIIHRDIKSANLFLTEDFEIIKLGDLNVAKIAKNDLASTQIGTPYYLAPEIWKNEVYSYKCDVFSLGCVLYEMAALKVPFEGNSLQDLYKKITRGLISKIPKEYSDDLYTIIKLCLTTDPRQRPTVAQLLSHPIVGSHMASLNIDLKGDQIILDKLMNTIKIDKGIYKVKIALPNKKCYRARSADPIRPIELCDQPQKQVPMPRETRKPDQQLNRNSSQNKIDNHSVTKKSDEKEKAVPLKPSIKLPPVKTGAKAMPPPPSNLKASPPKPLNPPKNDRKISQDKAGRKSVDSRDDSASKNNGEKRQNDYLERLIAQNNQYLKDKVGKIEPNNKSRKRLASADSRSVQNQGPGNFNQRRGNAPVWWG